MDQQRGHKELRDWLADNLDLEELYVLGAELGIDLDNVGGEGKQLKIVEWVRYLERRDRLDELYQAVERLQSNPSLLAREARDTLPAKCPFCNAPLDPDSAGGTRVVEVRCAYCGCTVRAGAS